MALKIEGTTVNGNYEDPVAKVWALLPTDDRERWLFAGDIFTMGRAIDRDIELVDSALSRRVGALFCGPHFVAVTRDPECSHDLWVDRGGVRGAELVERGATAIVDHGEARLLARTSWSTTPDLAVETAEFYGQPVARIVVQHSVRVLDPVEEPHPGPSDDLTVSPSSTLRERSDFLTLVALCERMFLDEPTNNPRLPNREDIRQRLLLAGRAVGSTTISNQLTEWRERLGIPRTDGANCHCATAVAAVQTGLVTRDHVLDLRLVAGLQVESKRMAT